MWGIYPGCGVSPGQVDGQAAPPLEAGRLASFVLFRPVVKSTLRLHGLSIDELAAAVVGGDAPSAVRASLADFEISDTLGSGGNAHVYRALHRPSGETVALKILKPTDRAAEAIARFDREVRCLVSLQHPNVCRLVAYGEEGPRRFLALELIEGPDLATLIGTTGPLASQVVTAIASQLFAAVAAVHAQGIVHRDIKPANIMITPKGIVKLLDFGIARAGSDASVTEHGIVVGTPAYMSPAQLVGSTLTPAFDLHALGASLLEALAGRNPVATLTAEQAALQIAREGLPPIFELEPAVTGILEDVVNRMTLGGPKRYRSLAEAAEGLAGIAAMVEQRRPGLLAAFVAEPHVVNAACRKAIADAEIARAQELLTIAPWENAAAAAFAFWRATRSDPGNEARDFAFRALCLAGGFTFVSVPKGDEGAALMEVATKTPSIENFAAVARCHRRTGNLFLAALWWRRLLQRDDTNDEARRELDIIQVGMTTPTPVEEPPAEAAERIRLLVLSFRDEVWRSASTLDQAALVAGIGPRRQTPRAPATIADASSSTMTSSSSPSAEAGGRTAPTPATGGRPIVVRQPLGTHAQTASPLPRWLVAAVVVLVAVAAVLIVLLVTR